MLSMKIGGATGFSLMWTGRLKKPNRKKRRRILEQKDTTMTKKNKNINPYAIHYKNERPRSKKSKHAGPVKPVISKQKNGKMDTNEQREVTDGSTDAILFIAGVMTLIGAIYAIARALNLI